MITIYGTSDDLVEIEGDVNGEVGPNRTITIGDEKQGLRIKFQYAVGPKSGAVWRGSIEQIDEGIPIFPVTVGEHVAAWRGPEERSYSVKFTIDCPPGTPVTVGKRNLAAKTT